MGDRILGAVCVAIALAMAWLAHGYQADFSYEPVGPRAFPTLLAAVLGLAGLWLSLRPARLPATDSGAVGGRGPALPVLLTMAAMLVYVLLFQWLGFVLATVLMALPVGRSFGGRWLACTGAGLGLGLGFYFLFDKVFDVILPTGVLAFILGGR